MSIATASGTTSTKSAPVYHRDVEAMGTIITIDLFGGEALDPLEIARALDDAALLLHEADDVFSTWQPHSPLSRLRRGEIDLDEVPREVAEVLDACRIARRLSQHWFDPWSMPGGVDPTGLVKGWAGQRALNSLRGRGLSGALVNAAGDVASFGGPAGTAAFRIGVASPVNPRQLAWVVESPGAVATSGTYERGNHLINPFTGDAAMTASATVTGPDLALADALATALALAGPAGLAFVRRIGGYEGLVIDTTGATHLSDGFPTAASVVPEGPA
jgi:thiamine biosynthesis lipoprotein